MPSTTPPTSFGPPPAPFDPAAKPAATPAQWIGMGAVVTVSLLGLIWLLNGGYVPRHAVLAFFFGALVFGLGTLMGKSRRPVFTVFIGAVMSFALMYPVIWLQLPERPSVVAAEEEGVLSSKSEAPTPLPELAPSTTAGSSTPEAQSEETAPAAVEGPNLDSVMFGATAETSSQAVPVTPIPGTEVPSTTLSTTTAAPAVTPAPAPTPAAPAREEQLRTRDTRNCALFGFPDGSLELHQYQVPPGSRAGRWALIQPGGACGNLPPRDDEGCLSNRWGDTHHVREEGSWCFPRATSEPQIWSFTPNGN